MKKAAVIGFPINHSWSPIIHNYWLEEYGVFGEYEKIEIQPDALENLIFDKKNDNKFTGLNVTIPHKEHAAKLCDQLSENAKKLGAVNLITFKNNMAYGNNTDGDGFIESMKETFPEIVIPKMKIAIFGAGGAAKSIALSLSKYKPEKMFIFNRNLIRAVELVKKLKIAAEPLHISNLKNAERSFDLLINATPLGMAGVSDLSPFDFKNIKGLNFFADIVYNPKKTKNMFLAEEQNIKTMGGLGMLLYQAVPAFEAFYGKKVKVSSGLRNHIAKYISRVEK
tara:strand:- start:774 stop:1616 length:843 start_codon:yes stop_codon:yes gene_type:complete